MLESIPSSLSINVTSERKSEIDYFVGIRTVGYREDTTSPTVAIVEAISEQFRIDFDAQFGNREDPKSATSNLVETQNLFPGRKTLDILTVIIRDDSMPEETECFDLVLFRSDTEQMIENFMCNTESDADGFYCQHEICIADDDG